MLLVHSSGLEEPTLCWSIVRILRAPPETLAGHDASYRDTVDMAQSVRDEVGLGVRVVLGPHPAAFAHQFERWVSDEGSAGKERAVENYRHSIEAALALVHEGHAHAIGEVGRPHWPVADEIWDLSNELLDETMHLAAQEGIPLQLHVEGESDDTYPDLARRATRQGMDLRKLVRHYSPPDVGRSTRTDSRPVCCAAREH